MKYHNTLFAIFWNNFYNFIFKKFNNIKIDKKEKIEDVKENNKDLKHSNSLQTAWLLNLKRLYNLTKKIIEVEKYHFLDVGCGNGIPLIYAFKKLKFKSYSGFDFILDYIEISEKNIQSSIGIKDTDFKEVSINVFQSNASKFVLDKDKSYFIFIFNSFDAHIMKSFLENNYEILKLNKSVIAYSNYKQLDVLKRFSSNIKIIEKFKIAIIFF